jgi:Rrf2 family protein
MKVSTKGRYALRVMIDLAQHREAGFVSLKEIAERQEISMKYLEMIVGILNRADFVQSLRGKSGGYKLARNPKDYTIGAILKLTEGSMAPVSCVECGTVTCERADDCITLPLWKGLDKVIDDYLESMTLEDLLERKEEN